jgi:autotransporter-associated beta strand protein
MLTLRRMAASSRCVPFFVAALLVPSLGLPEAATGQTWAVGTGNWNVGGNWVGGVAPASNINTALTFDSQANARYTSTNNIANPFLLNSITFGGTTTHAIVLKGDALQFSANAAGAAPSITMGGLSADIVQNSLSIDNTTLTYAGNQTGRVVLTGVISDGPNGAGSLVVGGAAGNGGLILANTAANTYSGGTTLNANGYLAISKGSLGTGALTINGGQIAGTVSFEGATKGTGKVSAGVPVTINGNATYGNVLAKSPAPAGTVSSTLIFDKGATLGANVQINVPSANNSATAITRNVMYRSPITGQIMTTTVVVAKAGTTSDNLLSIAAIGDGGNKFTITKTGNGIMTFTGANTYGGVTTVNGGTLTLVNGSIPQTAVVNNGGLLNGTGSIGNANVGVGAKAVTVNAGGAFKAGDAPGILTVTGGLTLNAGAILYANLEGPGGPGAANGYDQVQVTGGTSFNGAYLLPELDYAPSHSDTFYLIDNQDSIPETGTFANTYMFNGLTYIDLMDTVNSEIYTFEVSTTGDFEDNNPTSLTGNDLVLFDAVATGVIVPEPPSALILATGILAVLIAGAWKQHLRTCPCACSTRSLQGAAKG